MRITALTTDWLVKNHCPSVPSSHPRVKGSLSLLKCKKSFEFEKHYKMPLLSHATSHKAQTVLQGHCHSISGKISHLKTSKSPTLEAGLRLSHTQLELNEGQLLLVSCHRARHCCSHSETLTRPQTTSRTLLQPMSCAFACQQGEKTLFQHPHSAKTT